jgi:DNA-binding MarR family transcriptional regulator
MTSALPEDVSPPKGTTASPSPVDLALERALEGLFRLGANRRFDQHQAIAVGAAVTRAGYALLRTLFDHDSLSMRELAEASAMDVATASRQIPPLVEQDLVERRSAEEDARRVDVRLTPRGREVYQRIVDYRLGQLTEVLADWSESDRRLLTELVARLSRDLAGLPRDPNRDGGAS